MVGFGEVKRAKMNRDAILLFIVIDLIFYR